MSEFDPVIRGGGRDRGQQHALLRRIRVGRGSNQRISKTPRMRG